MRVLHVVTGLGRGGTEMTILRLVSMDPPGSHSVVSLTSGGEVSARLAAMGTEVTSLDLSLRPLSIICGLKSLIRIIRSARPAVIQTWLAKGNLIGGIAGLAAGNPRIIWNIRSTPPRFRFEGIQGLVLSHLLAVLSYVVPRVIVLCGETTREMYARKGYCDAKMLVIPNGLNPQEWRSEAPSLNSYRRSLRIQPGEMVLGQVANYYPLKRHKMLIEAFSHVVSRHPQTHLVLAGKGISQANQELVSLIQGMSLEGKVSLLGPQHDVKGLIGSFDILISPSAQEGFPNTVLEALFLGKPAIVSQAGESKRILGPGGWVFLPDSVAGLAETICQVILLGDTGLKRVGELGRKHVEQNYPEEKMRDAYRSLWESVGF